MLQGPLVCPLNSKALAGHLKGSERNTQLPGSLRLSHVEKGSQAVEINSHGRSSCDGDTLASVAVVLGNAIDSVAIVLAGRDHAPPGLLLFWL